MSEHKIVCQTTNSFVVGDGNDQRRWIPCRKETKDATFWKSEKIRLYVEGEKPFELIGDPVIVEGTRWTLEPSFCTDSGRRLEGKYFFAFRPEDPVRGEPAETEPVEIEVVFRRDDDSIVHGSLKFILWNLSSNRQWDVVPGDKGRELHRSHPRFDPMQHLEVTYSDELFFDCDSNSENSYE